MTEPGTNLPDAIRKRIEGEKEDAYRSEIRDLEARISEGLDRHLEERKKTLEARIEGLGQRAQAAYEKELAELRNFEEETLKLLGAEAERRRTERLAAQEEQRKERIRNEEEEVIRSAAEAEEKRKKAEAAAADPALKVRTLLKQIHGHMERGDMEMAAGAVAQALEIDAFNAELVDLDAKIREAIEADRFAAPAPAPTPEKKADKKAAKKEKEKGKGGKEKTEPAPAEQAPPVPTRRKKFPSWILTVIAVLLVAAVAVIVFVEYAPRHLSEPVTVAVLPWSETGNAPTTGILADALPEIVLDLLARESSPIALLGYSTTMNLSSLSNDPIPSLRSLGYSHFLRGHIGVTDSAYSLHVELTDSAGSTLWFADYTRNASEIILVPYEIAHGLNRHFGQDISGASAAVQLKNHEAYYLFLRGLAASHRRGGSGLDEAINAFSRSLALDSALAESYAGLASALTAKYTGDGNSSILEDAGSAAASAIRLAPAAGDGYFAMARILIEKHQYEDALALLDSSSRLSPRDSRLPFLRGLAFFRSGRTGQALDLMQKAYRLDPRNVEILGQLALLHQVQRSFERALWYRETAMFFSADSTTDLTGPVSDILALDPALRLNQGERVTSACLRVLGKNPADYTTLYSLARMLQVGGDIEESNKYLHSMESILMGMVRSRTADTRARMYLGLTLTRLGKYADGLAVAEAAASENPGDAEAKYFLARIYSLQMNSPRTNTVDETRKSKALDLLREALDIRFDNEQLGSADFYNIYSRSDIREALSGGGQ